MIGDWMGEIFGVYGLSFCWFDEFLVYVIILFIFVCVLRKERNNIGSMIRGDVRIRIREILLRFKVV